MARRLRYWRRIGIDHVYAEYTDDDHIPEPNPLDKDRHGEARPHGSRCLSEVMRVYVFEIRHGLVHAGDDNGHNYQQLNDVDTLRGNISQKKLDI